MRWLRIVLVLATALVTFAILADTAGACTRIGLCGKPRVCHQLADDMLVCMSYPDPAPVHSAYPIYAPHLRQPIFGP